jgi:nitrite reductase/ring-hydroxylating ferredoxin subunit
MSGMRVVSRLELAGQLDKLVTAGQRLARLVPPGRFRDALHGVWLGHPLHPLLVQASVGAWVSAGALDVTVSNERAARRLAALGLAAAVPAAAAGLVDWSEQHEQQMRVGIVHAFANATAVTCYGASLVAAKPWRSRAWRFAGLAAAGVGGLLGGHIAYRLAGGANHAEAVPHLLEPGWHDLIAEAELPEGKPVRRLLGEVPVVAIRSGGQVHVLADRCSHMSGSLAEGDLADGSVTCPWHGSVFCLRDGSVVRGPATAPQPAFEVRTVDNAVQVLLPGAG